MTYDIGELDGKTTDRIIMVKEVLDHAGLAIVTENLLGTRWTKLLINVGISGVSTALGSAGAQILDSDKAITAIVLLMIEAIKTSQALGIKLEPMQGVDPSFLPAAANENLDNVKNLLKMVFSSFGEAKASMLLDLEKGIPCEIEAINGYLYRMSREAGVATPVNDQVTTMIREIQDGKLRYDFSNLDRLELPDVAFYF
jgi:2-dehydropantoate 2-reductase